jgi:N utilization substance protein B
VTGARSSTRHRSREAALQVLYAVDMARRKTAETAGSEMVRAEEAFERAAAHFELPEGARVFAKELVTGVCRLRRELDDCLSAHSEHWRLDRMAAVDRNVLRIGAYEILHTDTPAPIAIDEAVELARRFAGEWSPAFVNGILDSVSREEREVPG